MPHRILLGVPDAALVRQMIDLAEEDPELQIIRTVSDASGVSAVLGRQEVDIVILHEDLGPLPLMDLAGELATRFPQVGVILLVAEATPELLRAALRAGARDVLAPPFSLESLQNSVRRAGSWAAAVSQRMSPEGIASAAGAPIGGLGGTVIAVAGAKGGVGTSTIALHLALAAARVQPADSVCLVDFDLQAGDLRSMLDLPPRRSVGDLVQVADLSGAQIEDALYRHDSGVRVLLGPEDGERAEEVQATVARSVIGALKFQHRTVVVDVGSTVTEASAIAVELADQVLVASTPDVPALRGANRLLELWSRLEIRETAGVRVVLNRASRNSEVQPDLGRRVLLAPLAAATIPADFRALEPALNSGSPARLEEGRLRSAFDRLATEAGVVSDAPLRAPVAADRGAPAAPPAGAQAGQASVELLGLAGLLIFFIMALWQMALIGYTFVLADHAAREGARSLAVGESVDETVRGEVPGAWLEGMEIAEEGESVKVTMTVPALLPALDSPFRLSASEGTVIEDARAAGGGAS